MGHENGEHVEDLGGVSYPERIAGGSRSRVPASPDAGGHGAHRGHVVVTMYQVGSQVVGTVELIGWVVGDPVAEAGWIRFAERVLARVRRAEYGPSTARRSKNGEG